MFKNTNFETSIMEVKKIKAKQLTTTLVIVAFLSITLASSAYAIDSNTQELTLDGSGVDSKIFLSISGSVNMVALDTEEGRSKIVDSKVKFYNSGGFSLKNYESGILVYGHPISDMQYKIVILTSDGVHRLLANVIDLNYYNISETIEPKSSLGADITRHDIPILERYEPSTEIGLLTTFNVVEMIFVNEEYSPNITVKNSNNVIQKLSGANMTIQISRDGNVMREFSGETNVSGKWSPVLKVLYPEFRPSFCYDVIITTQYEDLVLEQHDDFIVSTVAKYWESEDEYSLSQTKIESDYHCNEKDAGY